MEWMNIVIPIITALIPAGGLTGFFLARGKKREQEILNFEKILDMVQEERQEAKKECQEVKEEQRQLREAYKRQEAYIEELHKDKSALHARLDKANSRVTALTLLRCKVVDCPHRKPPFGAEAGETMRKISTDTLAE